MADAEEANPSHAAASGVLFVPPLLCLWILRLWLLISSFSCILAAEPIPCVASRAFQSLPSKQCVSASSTFTEWLLAWCTGKLQDVVEVLWSLMAALPASAGGNEREQPQSWCGALEVTAYWRVHVVASTEQAWHACWG